MQMVPEGLERVMGTTRGRGMRRECCESDGLRLNCDVQDAGRAVAYDHTGWIHRDIGTIVREVGPGQPDLASKCGICFTASREYMI